MALTLDLPSARLAEKPYQEIENVLAQLRRQVEARYNDKLAVLLLTASEENADGQPTRHRYVVKLSFVYRNYAETLLELNCRVGHGYPVDVSAFRKVVGRAGTKEELEKLLEQIFADPRTRNLILVNY